MQFYNRARVVKEKKAKKQGSSTQTRWPDPKNLSGDGDKAYFTEARSWADDRYTSAITSRNRYRLAFFTAMGSVLLLSLAIDSLIPLQHIEPLLINHYQNGRVSVRPMQQTNVPMDQRQIESDIVRYIINRESYSSSSYNEQYSLINLLSNNKVAKSYRKEQSVHAEQSPINVLGNAGFRTVHVDSVIFLDLTTKKDGQLALDQSHYNLAQVNFAVTDNFKDSAVRTTRALTALIAWDHRSMSNEPNARWRNWNGFTVIRYTVSRRNVSK